jgi:hypothetical protein
VTIEVEGYNYNSVAQMVSQLDYEQNDKLIIDQNIENEFILKKGTEVKIPANAFCHIDGSALESSEVEMTFKEVFDYADMVDERLFTQTEDQILETGGMIHIAASLNGQPVKLKDGKSIELLFPEQEDKYGMELFTGQEDENGIIWEETGEAISSVNTDKNVPFITVDLSPLLDLEIKDSDLTLQTFAPMPPFPHPARIAYPPYKENYTEEEYVKAVQKYEAVMKAHELDKLDRPEKIKIWIEEAERRRDIIFDHKRNYVRLSVIDQLRNSLVRLKADQYRISHDRLLSVLFGFLSNDIGKIEYNDWYYTKLAFGNTVVDARKQIYLEYPVFNYFSAAYFFPEFKKAVSEVNFRITSKKFEMGLIDERVMSRYVVASSNLGWINCDRFKFYSEDQKTNLEFASLSDDDQFYLIFKDIRSMIRPYNLNGKVLFRGVPKGEDVRLVAVNVDGGNANVATLDFTVSNSEDLKLTFVPAGIKDLKKALEI